AAIARAKARKVQQEAEYQDVQTQSTQESTEEVTPTPKNPAVAAAIARAKARKAQQEIEPQKPNAEKIEQENKNNEASNKDTDLSLDDLFDIPVFIDKNNQEKK
ncbi:MAG: hypothetical protein ACTH6Y_10400, partial [Vibrio hibernica]